MAEDQSVEEIEALNTASSDIMVCKVVDPRDWEVQVNLRFLHRLLHLFIPDHVHLFKSDSLLYYSL